MIKPGALVMAVLMSAVSAGTYFGLDLLPPGALPEPFGRAQKPEPPKPGTSTFAPGTTAVAAAPVAPAEPAPVAEPPVTEQDLAEEPAPAEPAPAQQAQAEPTPEPEPEPAPAPRPQPKRAPALVDEPAPAPAPSKKPKVTIVDGQNEAATQTASAEPARPTKQAPPESDVIKPWWPDSSKMPANQLKLEYAGQVQGEQAIALLFSAPLNLETLKQHAQVRTGSGQAVKGDWELGKNARLAVFRGIGSGRYTVVLGPQIADAKGFMLGQTLKGPVYIQPPSQP